LFLYDFETHGRIHLVKEMVVAIHRWKLSNCSMAWTNYLFD